MSSRSSLRSNFYRLLIASVRLNGLAKRWSLLLAGLGGAPQLEKFQIQRSSGVSFIGAAPRPDDIVVNVHIAPNVTLDAVISAFVPRRQPKLVEIDVDGLELRVLEGARQMLEARKTHFVIELSRDSQARYGIDPDDIARFLESFGYRPTPVSGTKLSFDRSDIVWKPGRCIRQLSGARL